MVRGKENALDVDIQITSSVNVRSHKEAKTKGLLLEDLGAIMAKMRKKRLKTKHKQMLRSKYKDYLTKFDPKSYEDVFLGYLQNSKAYIILNKHTMKVEDLLNVTFDESPYLPKTSPLEDDDLVEEEAIKVSEKKLLGNDVEDEVLENDKIVRIYKSSIR
nr:retrovirus-related Pol polyprotein from transposon TNT 1-94 [Tanacetum cinerariifolium]